MSPVEEKVKKDKVGKIDTEADVLKGDALLELCSTGSKLWNKWIGQHKNWVIDFSGMELPEDMDFSNFMFLNFTNFSNTKFSGNIKFIGAEFLGEVGFRNSNFLKGADFSRAKFLGNAYFDKTQFLGLTRFKHVGFTENAYFEQAGFYDSAIFEDTNFLKLAYFEKTKFLKRAIFTRVTFSKIINFEHATFLDASNFVDGIFLANAYFNKSEFQGSTRFESTRFSMLANFESAQFKGYTNFNGSEFLGKTHFKNALFLKRTRFEDVSFSGITAFTNATFKATSDYSGSKFLNKNDSPDFSNAVFESSVSIEGTYYVRVPDFRTTTFQTAVSVYDITVNFQSTKKLWKKQALERDDIDKYRCLKSIAMIAKDHESEQMFFAYETRAKRFYVTKGIKLIPDLLYDWLSSYGRSLAKPLIGISATWILTSIFYLYVSYLPYSLASVWKSIQFSATHLVPFLASSSATRSRTERYLYGDFGPPDLVSTINLIENFLGFLFIFLIGLALRNRFRLK